jgi:hypothetical protein
VAACAPSTVLQLRTGTEAVFAPITVDWGLAFMKPCTQKALAYWRSLCSGRKMPQRRELSPKAMREFLFHVNLVDVIRATDGSVADYTVSLQGQHAHDTYGPVMQRSLGQVLPPPIEARWRSCFGVACSAARPVRFHSRVAAGGKLWMEAEVLIAPLGDEIVGVDSLFAAFASWPAEAVVAPGRDMVP